MKTADAQELVVFTCPHEECGKQNEILGDYIPCNRVVDCEFCDNEIELEID